MVSFNKPSLFLQLAGTAVLAIGLWLHFDSQTKSVFELESDTKFYTGELGDHSGDRSHFCTLISRLLRNLGLPLRAERQNSPKQPESSFPCAVLSCEWFLGSSSFFPQQFLFGAVSKHFVIPGASGRLRGCFF